MEAHLKAHEFWKRFMKEMKVEAWDEGLEPVLKIICKNILRQKLRLGGDFAVAFATPTKRQRDMIRECLGSSLVFVVLNMSRECQEKRLNARHMMDGEEETVTFLTKLYDFFEKPYAEETDAITVSISDDMTVQEVVKEILHKISLV